MLELNKLYLMDCMDGMKTFPDKYFDLAIVDPPYGIGRSGQTETFTKNHKHKRKYFIDKKWDIKSPTSEYWKELFRISENMIVWGANYFTKFLPPSMGWVFWDKGQDLSMSDGELAYTSFNVALRRVVINRVELLKEGTIHPTQKPIKLYKWLLKKYAKPDFKIIDTHVGSASSIIAFLDFGCDWIGFEIDEDYHKAASERIEIHKQRPKPFITDGDLVKTKDKPKGFF